MSRSSLLREQQMRMAKEAEEAFLQQQAAAAAGVEYNPGMLPAGVVAAAASGFGPRAVKRNELPIHGNPHTFNMHTLLANLIVDSDYFRALRTMSEYPEIVAEAARHCTHAEPWAAGTSRSPSTLFCLLFKCFTLRLTQNQMRGLLHSQDAPYLRCLGLLYLRYTCPPEALWDWMAELVDDPEVFAPGADPNAQITMGEYVRKLLTDMKYYGTMLPRIPVKQERRIKMELVLREENRERAQANRAVLADLMPGARVRAIYSDQDSAPAWYDAEIVTVHPPEDGAKDPSFTVVFPEYENEELVSLGELQLPQAGGVAVEDDEEVIRAKERARDEKFLEDRGYARRKNKRKVPVEEADAEDPEEGIHRPKQRGKGDDLSQHLLKKVMQSDRQAVAARGRDYAQRPASYKGSLSLKMDRYTHRKRSRSRSPDRRGGATGGPGGSERPDGDAGERSRFGGGDAGRRDDGRDGGGRGYGDDHRRGRRNGDRNGDRGRERDYDRDYDRNGGRGREQRDRSRDRDRNYSRGRDRY